MGVRIRLTLTEHHAAQLQALAEHYGVAALGSLLLAQAVDDLAQRGHIQPSGGHNEPQNSPKVATPSPGVATLPPYGPPPAPPRPPGGHPQPRRGQKVATPSPGVAGTDLALSGSERERSGTHSQDPPDVLTLTHDLTLALNELGGTTHNPHDQASQRAVYCRLHGEGCEAATPEAMLAVVKAKAEAWRGTKYAPGLTLLTLLGDRFGQYLGTAEVDTTSKVTPAGGAFEYLGGDE